MASYYIEYNIIGVRWRVGITPDIQRESARTTIITTSEAFGSIAGSRVYMRRLARDTNHGVTGVSMKFCDAGVAVREETTLYRGII